MNRAQRAAVVVGSVSAAAALLAAGVPVKAADAGVPDWRILATVHYGAAGNASGYSAVVALGKGDAWAFGGTNPGGNSSPAAESWNGSRWHSSSLPSGLSGFIVAANASSPRNVWAVGDGYALRWNGVKWSVAKTWRQSGQLTSVAAINANDVWVFGSATFSGQASLGTWHFNGRDWIRATGLADAIYRASAVARHNIWAITVSPRGGWVAHFNGRAWRRVRSSAAALANTQLDDVLAVSRTSVWVSGIAPASGAKGRLVLAHWNGERWKRLVAPWGVQLPERFAPDGAGGIWIPVVSSGAGSATWIFHLSRSGRWTRIKIAAASAGGVGVGDLALVPGTTALWGSGGLVTAAGGDAAIWAHLVVPRRVPVPDSQNASRKRAITVGTIIRDHAVEDFGAVQRLSPPWKHARRSSRAGHESTGHQSTGYQSTGQHPGTSRDPDD